MITGSFTMFSFFNSWAVTKLIILELSRGVAVKSKTKEGFNTLSISIESSETAL